jgi:hypothetical protein
MTAKYNPDGLQGINSDGQHVELTMLTKDELIQNLCQAMDALERLDQVVTGALFTVIDWRNGKMKPEEE